MYVHLRSLLHVLTWVLCQMWSWTFLNQLPPGIKAIQLMVFSILNCIQLTFCLDSTNIEHCGRTVIDSKSVCGTTGSFHSEIIVFFFAQSTQQESNNVDNKLGKSKDDTYMIAVYHCAQDASSSCISSFDDYCPYSLRLDKSITISRILSVQWTILHTLCLSLDFKCQALRVRTSFFFQKSIQYWHCMF